MSVLEVHGLEVRRGGQPLVQGVSFRAGRGEIVALMGTSGSGKTTVLRAIAGLDTPASGTVVTEGRVGMVFQFHHLFAHLPALHNVWLAPVHVLREPRPDAERRARALIDKLGVGQRADALPHELSGGEAQRVAIARALAVEPQVLLMDEPTASLDPDRRDDLARTLVALAAEGRTLVVATHDAAFVNACGARVLVMEGGRIQ
jgi:ABC-type polar amino acid transport system ATPase subunit